ncbi:MAG: metallophosphoesterase, partial [Saprospiraceae bacterium]|nr:metallophosphoesterase [Saprospiraceae bacterium]
MRFLCLTLLLTLFLSGSPLSAQEAFQKPTLSTPDSWSLILLPDPQTYMKFGRNQAIFDLMTAWVSENIEPLNIEMVLCTGDLVEQNDMVVPDKVNGNLPSKYQWEAISHAFKVLDGKVPYILAAGNHDFGFKNIEHRKSNYNQYFPADRNWASEKLLKAVGKNFENRPTLENAAFEFISPHQRKFLFVNLEFAPRDTMIAWAKEVANQAAFKDHTVVLLTHSYLNAAHEHIAKENYPITDGNYGKAIWEKLVQPSQNIQ